MSAKPRDPVKDKENVQPLYLSKKNKGSKIGKGSFLKSLEPSTFYDKTDDAQNLSQKSEPEVEEFEIEDVKLSVLNEHSALQEEDSIF